MLSVTNNFLIFVLESMSSNRPAWIIAGSVVGALLLIAAVTTAAILVKKYVYEANSKATRDDSK